jgi:hypothetical protein
MRSRVISAAAAIGVAVLLGAAVPAAASAGQAVRQPPPAPSAMVRGSFGGPVDRAAGAQIETGTDDLLGSDSCVPYDVVDEPYLCMATGWSASSTGVQPVGLNWASGQSAWQPLFIPGAMQNNLINLPNEISCVGTNVGTFVTCEMAGEHYTNPRYESLLTETSSDFGWGVQNESSPRHNSWSAMNDASCTSDTFCMLVGQAGNSRVVKRRIHYTSHDTAYTWSGSGGLTKLNPPVPGHSKYAEFSALSCVSSTFCMAAGNYYNSHSIWRTFAASWTSGSWRLLSTPDVKGEKFSTFEGVSCPTASLCMAVGQAYRPGSRPFAEQWSDGKWTLSILPKTDAGVDGVSCPTATDCLASGFHGNASLIEAWNGASWSVQPTPATSGKSHGDVLFHVSCVTGEPDECVAVGGRFNPSVRPSRRTYRNLAEVWDGASWQLMSTPNS